MKKSPPNPFVLGLIVLLGLMVGYFYDSHVNADSTYDIPLPADAQDQSFLKFKDLHLDFSVLQNAPFTTLKTLGEFPIKPGASGRQDPFAPF